MNLIGIEVVSQKMLSNCQEIYRRELARLTQAPAINNGNMQLVPPQAIQLIYSDEKGETFVLAPIDTKIIACPYIPSEATESLQNSSSRGKFIAIDSLDPLTNCIGNSGDTELTVELFRAAEQIFVYGANARNENISQNESQRTIPKHIESKETQTAKGDDKGNKEKAALSAGQAAIKNMALKLASGKRLTEILSGKGIGELAGGFAANFIFELGLNKLQGELFHDLWSVDDSSSMEEQLAYKFAQDAFNYFTGDIFEAAERVRAEVLANVKITKDPSYLEKLEQLFTGIQSEAILGAAREGHKDDKGNMVDVAGISTVFVNGFPLAKVSGLDMVVPDNFPIVQGSPTVLVNGYSAARKSSPTTSSLILEGAGTVLIGDVPSRPRREDSETEKSKNAAKPDMSSPKDVAPPETQEYLGGLVKWSQEYGWQLRIPPVGSAALVFNLGNPGSAYGSGTADGWLWTFPDSVMLEFGGNNLFLFNSHPYATFTHDQDGVFDSNRTLADFRQILVTELAAFRQGLIHFQDDFDVRNQINTGKVEVIFLPIQATLNTVYTTATTTASFIFATKNTILP